MSNDSNPWTSKAETHLNHDLEFMNSMAEWHQSSMDIKEATLLVRQARRTSFTLERKLDKIKAAYTVDLSGSNEAKRTAELTIKLRTDNEYMELEADLFDNNAMLHELMCEIEVLKSMEKRLDKWTERLNIASEHQ